MTGSKKTSAQVVLLALMASITLVLFQNCGQKSGVVGSANSPSVTSTTLPNAGVGNPDSAPMKLEYTSSAQTSQDCSATDAWINLTITNAASNISLCQEYTLNMPAGNSRNGEKNVCDSPAATFTRADQISTMKYDSIQRKWTQTDLHYLKNDLTVVPGTYKIWAMDSGGAKFSSPAVVVTHTGYTDCNTYTHSQTPSDAIGLYNVYRFWDGAKSEHFYTLLEKEGKDLGLAPEGIGFKTLINSAANTKKLYRCQIVDSNRHFTAVDPNCEGYKAEGDYGFVYITQVSNSTALYRMFNKTTLGHLTTTNEAEGLANGYVREFILGYVLP